MKITKEVKIGAYIVVIIFMMYWLFNFLRGQDIFNKSINYYAYYENVEGLVPTAQIYIKGLKVGIVEKIEYEQKDKLFEVKLRIESGYIIPDNSIAQIYSSDLMGNKAIRILIGNSPKQLAAGSTMGAGITTDLMAEIAPLKGKLDSVLTKVDVTFAAINNILSPEKQDEVKNIITNLDKSITNLASLMSLLNAEKSHLAQSLENAEIFTASLASNTENITATLNNLRELSDTLRAAELGTTVKKINNLLSAVQDPKGTTGQLISNDELYRNISAALHDLDLLLQDLKANPKKYVKLSLF